MSRVPEHAFVLGADDQVAVIVFASGIYLRSFPWIAAQTPVEVSVYPLLNPSVSDAPAAVCPGGKKVIQLLEWVLVFPEKSGRI